MLQSREFLIFCQVKPGPFRSRSDSLIFTSRLLRSSRPSFLTDSSLIEEKDTDVSEAELDEELVNEIAEL